jgi:hypothetical protein
MSQLLTPTNRVNGYFTELLKPVAPIDPVQLTRMELESSQLKLPFVATTSLRFGDSGIKLRQAGCNLIIYPSPNALVNLETGMIFEFLPTMPSQVMSMLVNEKNNAKNRGLSPAYVKALARFFKSDGFIPSTDCLGIFASGQLANGQHRLFAGVEFGHDLHNVPVFWNLPKKAVLSTDQGIRRTNSQAIYLAFPGMAWVTKEVTSIANRMIFGNLKTGGGGHGETAATSGRMPMYPMHHFLKKHEKKIRAVKNIFPGQKQGLTGTGVVAALCTAAYHVRMKDLTLFGNILYTGDDHGCRHQGKLAPLNLRKHIMKMRTQAYRLKHGQPDQRTMFWYTHQALQAFMAHKFVKLALTKEFYTDTLYPFTP